MRLIEKIKKIDINPYAILFGILTGGACATSPNFDSELYKNAQATGVGLFGSLVTGGRVYQAAIEKGGNPQRYHNQAKEIGLQYLTAHTLTYILLKSIN